MSRSHTSHVSELGAVAPTKDDTESKRKRRLTEKGKGPMISLIDSYRKRLFHLEQQLDEHMNLISSSGQKNTSDAFEFMKHTFSRYIRESEECITFLQRQHTEETSKELAAHQLTVKNYKSKVSTLLTKEAKPETKEKSLSKKSSTVFSALKSKSSSKTSRRTSIEGSTLSQRKAKAEAARVKLEYANREGELIKR